MQDQQVRTDPPVDIHARQVENHVKRTTISFVAAIGRSTAEKEQAFYFKILSSPFRLKCQILNLCKLTLSFH